MADGNRIDNRQRGNAHQLHEKYKTLARDAQMQGDRVQAEYYLQFADHYFRLLAEQRSRQEEMRPRPRDNNLREEEFGADGEDADRIDLTGLPGPARILADAEFGESGDDRAAAGGSDSDVGGNGRSEDRRSRAPRRETRPRMDAPVEDAPVAHAVAEADVAPEEVAPEDTAEPAPRARKAPVRRTRKAEAATPAAAELFPDAEAAEAAPAAPRRRGRPRRNPEATAADA